MKKIYFIAPYDDIYVLARQVIDELNAEIEVVSSHIKDVVVVAKELKERGAQIIITRGGAALRIKEQVDISVVEVKVSGYDILRALAPYIAKGFGKIGIIGFANIVGDCHKVAKLLGIVAPELVIAGTADDVDWDAVREQAQQFVDSNNIEVIIGDNAVKRMNIKSKYLGMIHSGRESLEQAIMEAENILRAQEEERKNTEKFRTILDFIHDGLVAVDELGIINSFNPAAVQLLNTPVLIGKKLNTIIPEFSVEKMLGREDGHKKNSRLCFGGSILFKSIPVMIDDKINGAIVTFRKVDHIQSEEKKIRNALYTKGFVVTNSFSDIVGNSEKIRMLTERAKKYAKSDATILIQGENGTGKEVFAQSIHACSNRSLGPFVAINCSALPSQLLESELFGYEEGAFTGAKKGGKQGLFELAHLGTIFLDEIGDMPKDVQVKLLRVIEERKIMRIGSDNVTPVNVRIIAATNADLKQRIQTDNFRMDLFYRLNVLNIYIPALRERKEDIPMLAEFLWSDLAKIYGINTQPLHNSVIKGLLKHDWPGNIRELKNVLERLLFSSMKGEALVKDVENIINESYSFKVNNSEDEQDFLKGSLHDIKKKIIANVLREEGYNKTKVAKRLGINRGTVERFL